jgi:SAM-dependent methyltransferase
MPFSNVYADGERAKAYSTLEFPGTYYLAFRDLPAIIGRHIKGRDALDFGCGAGRSTRFLKKLGFDAIGIDISSTMIDEASKADPDGTYHLVHGADFSVLNPESFDLVLCAFPFDNIPDEPKRVEILRGLRRLLRAGGHLILLGSAPEIYVHEWASFTTKDFAENAQAKSGDTVRIVMKDVADQRPVVDAFWLAEDYQNLFAASRLHVVALYQPLGRRDEPYQWISETSVSPWLIYVTERVSGDPGDQEGKRG